MTHELLQSRVKEKYSGYDLELGKLTFEGGETKWKLRLQADHTATSQITYSTRNRRNATCRGANSLTSQTLGGLTRTA